MAHLLVVDDEIDSRQTLVRVLKHLQHTSDVAGSASEAVQKAENGNFDMVLMDIRIPLKPGAERNFNGGLEATKRILANPSLRTLPIVALTAQTVESQKSNMLAAGCREFLQKGAENFLERTAWVINRYLSHNSKVGVKQSELADTVIVPVQKPVAVAAPTAAQASAPVNSAYESSKKAQAEPTTSTDGLEIRKICAHLERALAIGEELLAIAKVRADAKYLEEVESLCSCLQQSHQRFSREDPPRGRDELPSHWIINGVFGAHSSCEGLGGLEKQHFEDEHRELIVAAMDRIKQIIELSRVWDRAFAPVSQNATTLAPVAPIDLADPLRSVGNLLVVDDDWGVRDAMEKLLRGLGHGVVSCGHPTTAFNLLEKQHFDALLLDVDLKVEGTNGLQMLTRIRATPALAQLPIIIVSGSGGVDSPAEAINLGADDYLTKPISVPLLRARIESCLKQVQVRRKELEKFLPAKVIDSVLRHPQQMRQGRPADVTVMFCDIREFSRVSERIGAPETIRWISDIMDRLSDSVLSHGGTLVDYIGDELMAMWGAPQEDAEHAQQACRCALALQRDLIDLNDQWRVKVGAETRIGIGLHSGTAVVGNTGSKFRFKYGPLGPTVNIASRIQGATKYLCSSILISANTAMRIPNSDRGRKLCKVYVQNIGAPIELYELSSDQDEATKRRNEMYERALRDFESEEFESAISLLAGILKDFPGDGPTQLLMSRVIQCQLGQGFDPVWTLPGK